jgi:hypothetical protein
VAPHRIAAHIARDEGTNGIGMINVGILDDAVFPGMRAAPWHRALETNVDGLFSGPEQPGTPMICTRLGCTVDVGASPQ